MFSVYISVNKHLKDCCGASPKAVTEHSCMVSETTIECLVCGRHVSACSLAGNDSETSAAEYWNRN